MIPRSLHRAHTNLQQRILPLLLLDAWLEEAFLHLSLAHIMLFFLKLLAAHVRVTGLSMKLPSVLLLQDRWRLLQLLPCLMHLLVLALLLPLRLISWL